MLKISFWILLAANVVLFVFQQTYFDAPVEEKREPERLSQQVRADELRLVLPDEISRSVKTPVVPKPSSAMTTINPAEMALAIEKRNTCLDIGSFSKEQSTQFEQLLSNLSIKAENIQKTSQAEGGPYMVMIPPSSSKAEADKKIGEVKASGIDNFFLIQEPGKFKWAISLGVFKTLDAAASYAANVKQKGLASVQVAPRGNAKEKINYKLTNLNDAQLKLLEHNVKKRFTTQSVQKCSLSPS